MKLLLIEDDRRVAAYLRKGIVEAGFAVDIAHRGDDGLHLARVGDYDLIVLDVMLPGCDGWSVIADLRAAGRYTPVLFLSAMDAVSDRVRGLELGADDYLVKPFAFSEFLARVRTVIRRGSTRQNEILRVGDLEVDTVRFAASRSGRKLDLTPKVFSLLALLARRAGDVLSRTLIAEQVWDMNFDSDSNVIDVQVRRLRSKVDDPFPSKLIHTVRGVGYVLEVRD
ncbi:heavy metal response regulator transcription factor [Singulisphaera acidiphila]|uniref:Heavy metal response regulator n=1 Tax=Singulisphaera acidiphila (strain ATCC BAA-1392 / DSM 18658 / VKM B-2454 / MOB10) TaxID=886293 RepID=L0DNJ1_SINAD|nr:heavy metal response regulator transcription factor [Singulisphaera acidiphila]AGA30832.1 heavy metal response regulator [Singulisphaera acidiphila DSM 18658]